MDWTKVLESSLGPLLGSFTGAAAALSSLWVKESLDRRRSVQEWFEQQYVFGAIDPLIELLRRWTHIILQEHDQAALPGLAMLPHLEISRLNRVLRSPSLDRMFYALSNAVGQSPNTLDQDHPIVDWPHIASEVLFLRDALIDLQSRLLAVRIGRKADLEKLHLKAEILAVRQRIEEHANVWVADGMFRLRTRSTELGHELKAFQQRIHDSRKTPMTVQAAKHLRDEFNEWAGKARQAGLLFPDILGELGQLSNELDQILVSIQKLPE